MATVNNQRGIVKGPYRQKSIKKRIEALFLDNIGKVLTREQILEVAKNPETSREPENWHQRLFELRTDVGYTILSHRDDPQLKVSEYMMPTSEKRVNAQQRISIDKTTWDVVLKRANYRCEWNEGGEICWLREGDIDPVGGGTVKLTPDHKVPHASGVPIDPKNPDHWQALCGRHQVIKKNYWNHATGWLNVYAIVQAASEREKRQVYEFLEQYFKGKSG